MKLNQIQRPSDVLSASQIRALPPNVHCKVRSLEGGEIAPIALEDVHPGDLDAVPIPEAVLGTRGNADKFSGPHFVQNMGEMSSSAQTGFLAKQNFVVYLSTNSCNFKKWESGKIWMMPIRLKNISANRVTILPLIRASFHNMLRITITSVTNVIM